MPLIAECGRVLQFGLNQAVPDGVRAAWGARWIVSQTGDVDQLADRQSMFFETAADRDELLGLLSSGVGKQAQERCSTLLRGRQMRTQVAGEFVLFDDARVRIVGNSNASCGYCYVAAWLKSV